MSAQAKQELDLEAICRRLENRQRTFAAFKNYLPFDLKTGRGIENDPERLRLHIAADEAAKEFFYNAQFDITALIAEVKRLRAAVERVRELRLEDDPPPPINSVAFGCNMGIREAWRALDGEGE